MKEEFKVGDIVTTDWMDKLKGVPIEIQDLNPRGYTSGTAFKGKVLLGNDRITTGIVSNFTHMDMYWKVVDPFEELFAALDKLEDGKV